MVTFVAVATATVVAVNVVEVLPPGTVTVPGTWATAVLLLESATTEPPVGAGPFNLTVPVELLPPVTDVGLSETVDTTGGFTVRVALALPP
jgi:hypothetical protein